MKLEGIKVFKREDSRGNFEIRILNFEDGTFQHYLQDKSIGFLIAYSEPKSFEAWGYKSGGNCYRELKKRGYISDIDLIDTDLQEKSEIEGWLKLAEFRKSMNKGYIDVIEWLRTYGYTYKDAIELIEGI